MAQSLKTDKVYKVFSERWAYKMLCSGFGVPYMDWTVKERLEKKYHGRRSLLITVSTAKLRPTAESGELKKEFVWRFIFLDKDDPVGLSIEHPVPVKNQDQEYHYLEDRFGSHDNATGYAWILQEQTLVEKDDVKYDKLVIKTKDGRTIETYFKLVKNAFKDLYAGILPTPKTAEDYVQLFRKVAGIVDAALDYAASDPWDALPYSAHDIENLSAGVKFVSDLRGDSGFYDTTRPERLTKFQKEMYTVDYKLQKKLKELSRAAK